MHRAPRAARHAAPLATPRLPSAGRADGVGPLTWDRVVALGPRIVDAGLLAGIGVLVLLDLTLLDDGYVAGRREAVLAAISVLSLGAVAVRQRWPLGSFGVVVAAIVALRVGYDRLDAAFLSRRAPTFAPVAALSALVVPLVRRRTVGVAAAAVVAGAGTIATLLRWPLDRTSGLVLLVLYGGTFAVGASAGTYLRNVDRQQRLAAQQVRVDERRDLARELHDLVAHYVTGIVVQAQAARVVADADPRAAGAALDRIEGAGKDALTAMRRLVGALRDDEGTGPPVVPPVGLAGLDDLVSASTAGGLDVRLTVEPGAAEAVPGAVAASAHRIVQESLTNVRRHAVEATHAAVDVRVAGRWLVVSVTDDGRSSPSAPRGERGYGLVGMQERADALGGSLRAGPLDPPARGWSVVAHLPLDEAAGAPAPATPPLTAGGPP
ncbi:MAG TPA: histidine kinase [Aquihabitans sp.]|nr:histidine kinase [Aquihabitans sp.]